MSWSASTSGTQCSDGIDNDSDGQVDLADMGCVNANDTEEGNPPPTHCSDGIDNDGDGLVDLGDPGCASAADNDELNQPPPASACSDGHDNDGDGRVDLGDPGCANATDNDEFNPPPPPPPPFGPPPGFPQQPGPTAGGPGGGAQLEQASCRRSGRYRGRTSQDMRMCFTLARNRRRITQFEFNWKGFCDAGRSEALTEVDRGGLPRVGRDGRFRLSSTSFSLSGRLTRRGARGTLEITTSGAVGDCESGLLRWSARRG